jgi:hypothetical protein
VAGGCGFERVRLFGIRKFNQYTLRSTGPTGTQFEGLPHIGIADELYNCNKTDAVARCREARTAVL